MKQYEFDVHGNLSRRQALPAMIGIALVAVLIALDQTVVSTALPSVIQELQDFAFYSWVVNGYLLASVAVVPVFGRLGDMFGRKRFVLISISIFVTASILCACANSMAMLVLARVLQGFGGGMMVGNAYACVADMFADARARVKWQIVIAAAIGIGNALGPSLGGLLTETFGWRSTFLVNVPVGIASLVILWHCLPDIRSHSIGPAGRPRIDYLGAALMTATLAMLQIGVEDIRNGVTLKTLLIFSLAIVFSCAFIRCEKRASHPIIPLDMFKSPDLVRLLAMSVLMGGILFTLIFFTPLLLQGGFGLSPHEAGILVTPLAACISIGSVVNTRIVVRMKQPMLILSIGFFLMAVATMTLFSVYISTPRIWLVGASVLAGLGLGFCINNINVFSQNIVGKTRFGVVTALLQSTRMIGGMFGMTLVGTLVNYRYAVNMEKTAAAELKGSALEGILSAIMNPQYLLDDAIRRQVSNAVQAVPALNEHLISLGRMALVDAVHWGMLVTGISALFCLYLSCRMLHLRLITVAEAQNAYRSDKVHP